MTTHYIEQLGLEKCREILKGAPIEATLFFYFFDEVNDELLGPEYYRENGMQHFDKRDGSWGFCLDPQVAISEPHDALMSIADLRHELSLHDTDDFTHLANHISPLTIVEENLQEQFQMMGEGDE